MTTLVCFLEELSAQVFLEGVLPRLLPENIIVQYIVFEGKQDLEKQIVKRLRNWRKPNSVFLVMRYQDDEDCISLKARLSAFCAEAGRSDALVRIVCHELEGFFFGDLTAVGNALNIRSIASYQNKAKYRIPDHIVKPSKELGKLTNKAYQKIGGSREIGKIISLEENTSHSFLVLISGIKRLCGLYI
jgi:hypothetical protein